MDNICLEKCRNCVSWRNPRRCQSIRPQLQEAEHRQPWGNRSTTLYTTTWQDGRESSTEGETCLPLWTDPAAASVWQWANEGGCYTKVNAWGGSWTRHWRPNSGRTCTGRLGWELNHSYGAPEIEAWAERTAALGTWMGTGSRATHVHIQTTWQKTWHQEWDFLWFLMLWKLKRVEKTERSTVLMLHYSRCPWIPDMSARKKINNMSAHSIKTAKWNHHNQTQHSKNLTGVRTPSASLPSTLQAMYKRKRTEDMTARARFLLILLIATILCLMFWKLKRVEKRKEAYCSTVHAHEFPTCQHVSP